MAMCFLCFLSSQSCGTFSSISQQRRLSSRSRNGNANAYKERALTGIACIICTTKSCCLLFMAKSLSSIHRIAIHLALSHPSIPMHSLPFVRSFVRAFRRFLLFTAEAHRHVRHNNGRQHVPSRSPHTCSGIFFGWCECNFGKNSINKFRFYFIQRWDVNQ